MVTCPINYFWVRTVDLCFMVVLPTKFGATHISLSFVHYICLFSNKEMLYAAVPGKRGKYSWVYTVRMSSTFNGSSALECFELRSPIKIHNGIMLDFYLGLPHNYHLSYKCNNFSIPISLPHAIHKMKIAIGSWVWVRIVICDSRLSYLQNLVLHTFH